MSIVIEQSHDAKTLITFLLFLQCHFKKRKKSRFLDSENYVKNVFSNPATHTGAHAQCFN